MEAELTLGIVIVSPVALILAGLLFASEAWLKQFGALVCSLGRPM